MKRLGPWRFVLAASLLLNLCFALVAGYVVHRKGGMRYLRNYRAILQGDSVTIDHFPTYYRQRYSTFWADPVKTGAVILAGDSLTEQNDWTTTCGPTVLNRGIGADTSVGLLFRLNEILRHRPKKLFLLIGISDLRIGRGRARILETYDQILGQIRRSSAETKVYVQSILPINPKLFGSEIDPEHIRQVNQGLLELAGRHQASYLDVHAQLQSGDVLDPKYTVEGVHLTDEGYRRWEATLQGVGCE